MNDDCQGFIDQATADLITDETVGGLVSNGFGEG